VYRRLLAVLEFDHGTSVRELARLLNVHCQSIYNWIDRFCQQRQIADLADQYGIGRPTLWTEQRVAWLRALLSSSPDQWGYFANDWTVPLLQEQLRHCAGQTFADDTIRRQLHRLGYVWKRGRYFLAPDPELEKKTAHSQENPTTAAPKCAAGSR
jgi:transposase